jgi:hypothetical protein
MIDGGIALWTRTERPKIVIGVDPGTVTIVPVKFDRIVSYWANINQLSIGNRDKLPAGAVPLAKSARAMAPQVRFWISSRMVIIPQNPDDRLCFNVINLGRISASHARSLAFKAQPDRPLRPSYNRSLCDSLNTSAVLCRAGRLSWRQ